MNLLKFSYRKYETNCQQLNSFVPIVASKCHWMALGGNYELFKHHKNILKLHF